MALWKKEYPNEEMFDRFVKIMREDWIDVHFIFELNDDNVNNNDDAVTEPPASKIVRYDANSKSSVCKNEDINFVKISAHKKVLAASSPVFNAMFNGELKETGDIKIVDASPDSFREFLQFFYSNRVKLTMKNLDDVIKLTDKYDVEAGWPIVESFFKRNLIVDDVLWGLHLAVKFRRDNLIAHCTDMIEQNSSKVCDMVEIDDNGKPTLCSNPNSRPMTDADLANIFSLIFTMIKKNVPKPSPPLPTQMADILSVKLQQPYPSIMITKLHENSLFRISFSSNCTLLLTHITFAHIAFGNSNLSEQYFIKVNIADIEIFHAIPYGGGTIKLTNPVLIQANRIHTIQTKIATKFAQQPPYVHVFSNPSEPVQVAPNIQITFYESHSKSIVAGMDFVRYCQ